MKKSLWFTLERRKKKVYGLLLTKKSMADFGSFTQNKIYAGEFQRWLLFILTDGINIEMYISD